MRLGTRHTKETLEKIGASSKGRRHSEETKLRISNTMKSKQKSPEHITNILKSLSSVKHRQLLSELFKGRKFSLKWKQNLSKSAVGRKLSTETKEKISLSTIEYMASRPTGKHRAKWGYFYSNKNKKQLFFRSTLERNWYEVLENSPKIVKFEPEPFSIPYKLQENPHRYVPDLLIHFSDGTRLLVEIRPEPNYFRDNEKTKAKFAAATNWCVKNNIHFSVWGYKELSEWWLPLLTSTYATASYDWPLPTSSSSSS